MIMDVVSRIAALLLLVLVVAACGGSDAADGEFDGEELFSSSVLAGNAGCITCHSLQADRVLVGPSMAGIATRAGDREPGVSAADYIRKSILNPSAYVVEGFAEGQMLDVWADSLSTGEVDALVDYLLTLDGS